MDNSDTDTNDTVHTKRSRRGSTLSAELNINLTTHAPSTNDLLPPGPYASNFNPLPPDSATHENKLTLQPDDTRTLEYWFIETYLKNLKFLTLKLLRKEYSVHRLEQNRVQGTFPKDLNEMTTYSGYPLYPNTILPATIQYIHSSEMLAIKAMKENLLTLRLNTLREDRDHFHDAYEHNLTIDYIKHKFLQSYPTYHKFNQDSISTIFSNLILEHKPLIQLSAKEEFLNSKKPRSKTPIASQTPTIPDSNISTFPLHESYKPNPTSSFTRPWQKNVNFNHSPPLRSKTPNQMTYQSSSSSNNPTLTSLTPTTLKTSFTLEEVNLILKNAKQPPSKSYSDLYNKPNTLPKFRYLINSGNSCLLSTSTNNKTLKTSNSKLINNFNTTSTSTTFKTKKRRKQRSKRYHLNIDDLTFINNIYPNSNSNHNPIPTHHSNSNHNPNSTILYSNQNLNNNHTIDSASNLPLNFNSHLTNNSNLNNPIVNSNLTTHNPNPNSTITMDFDNNSNPNTNYNPDFTILHSNLNLSDYNQLSSPEDLSLAFQNINLNETFDSASNLPHNDNSHLTTNSNININSIVSSNLTTHNPNPTITNNLDNNSNPNDDLNNNPNTNSDIHDINYNLNPNIITNPEPNLNHNTQASSFFNISNLKLSPSVTTLLSLGGKYIPPYIINHISLKKQLLHRNLQFFRSTFYKLLFHDSKPYTPVIPKIKSTLIAPLPPEPNPDWYIPLYTHYTTCNDKINSLKYYNYPSKLDKEILSTLSTLLNDPNIVIKPSDKNLGLCILSKTDYIAICNKILSDNKTYIILPTNISDFYLKGFTHLKNILIKHKQLYNPNKTFTHLACSLLQHSTALNSTNLNVPSISRFYALPKVHKPYTLLPPGRPIVGSINSMTYYCSQYLHNILYPFTLTLPTICTSSISVKNTLQNKSFPPNSVIYCADVKSLYPSIDISFGLKAVKEVLFRFTFFKHETINLILDLLKWTLVHNVFTFNDLLYLQISGTAMGTPAAVVYANIVLYYIESSTLDKLPREATLFYTRFIDDILAIFDTTNNATLYHSHFNNFIPSIQLDTPTISNSGIFLDLTVKLESNIIDITLYQKPINKYQYIPYSSSHLQHILKNFVKTEIARYESYVTDKEELLNIISKFYKRLSIRGYPPQFLSKIFNEITCYPLPYLFPKKESVNTVSKQQLKPIIIIPTYKARPSQSYKSIFNIPQTLLDNKVMTKVYTHLEQDNSIVTGSCYPKNITRCFLHKPLNSILKN
jgi:hypothetical protein